MGSLFKTRDWWSTQLDDDHGFDVNSLTVANIDNSADDEDKIIVGGLSGVLRIFSLSKGIEDYEATDLLLEIDLHLPILQVAAGFFLAASDHVHLAILHPRKLSVYSVSGTGGFSEQGSSHNMLLLYEHKLQRSSFNMVIGPFGQGSSRDFFCIQSLDGTLSFFEQENFAFTRFLPNHLLPTPVDYSKTSDSFILSSSSWTLESYRYQVLAIASDDDSSRQDRVKGSNSAIGGRRISPDWSLILGENVNDLNIVMLDTKNEVVVVLGERNLFVVDVDGPNCRFSLQFDFCPVSMHSFSSNTSLIILIATEFKTVHVFKDNTLIWAAQTSFPPIAMKKAQIASCPGIIVALSDSGQLSCSYLGTNPSLNIVSISLQTEAIDVAKGEEEMNKLKQAISSVEEEFSYAISGPKKHHVQADAVIEVSKPEFVENSKHVENNNHPSNLRVIFPIKLHVKTQISEVKLTFDASTPFTIETNVIFFPFLESQSVNRTVIQVDTSNKYFPSSLKVMITMAYNNSSGAPRVICSSCFLPLDLLARSSKPSRDGKYAISLDVISNNTISLGNLFSDLTMNIGDEYSAKQELGIEFTIPQTSPVSLIISTKNPKQLFRIKSDGFEELAFTTTEIIRRLQSQNVKFDAAVIDRENGLHLKSYFSILDNHHKIRGEMYAAEYRLATYMAQLRTTEKRFLIKLKDRNPAPLNDIDLLLNHITSKAANLSSRIIDLTGEFEKTNNILSFCTRLLVQLSSIATGMKSEQANIVQSYLSSQLIPQLDEGWEERVEIALSEIVDVGSYNSQELNIPPNTKRLKALITALTNMLLKGDFITSRSSHDTKNVSRESPPPGSQSKKNYTNPATEVIPEEEEEDSMSVKQNEINYE